MWVINTQVSVHGDGEEGMNGSLSQHDDHTTDKETTVKIGLNSSVHHHSKRNGHSPHQKISHGQRHHETEGGLTESPARAHRPDHHHVSDTASYSDEDLQDRVDHLLSVRHHDEEGRHWRGTEMR